MNRGDHCTNLRKLLEVERSVIERHIDEHKWFRHIEKKDDAIVDFVEQFAWLMREIYCGHTCPFRNECNCAEPFLPSPEVQKKITKVLQRIDDDEIKKWIEEGGSLVE